MNVRNANGRNVHHGSSVVSPTSGVLRVVNKIPRHRLKYELISNGPQLLRAFIARSVAHK